MAINGATINDPMGPETYKLITEVGADCSTDQAMEGLIRSFLRYCGIDEQRANTTMRTTACPCLIEVVTTIAVKAGEELLISYRPFYWMQMLASGLLPRTTFMAAWAANQCLARLHDELLEKILAENTAEGLKQCFEILERLRGKRFSATEKRIELSRLLQIHRRNVPIWLRWEGVRVTYGGLGEKSVTPYRNQIYVRSSWTDLMEAEKISEIGFIADVLRIIRGLQRRLHSTITAADRAAISRSVSEFFSDMPRSDAHYPFQIAATIPQGPEKTDYWIGMMDPDPNRL
jgi:hypothetical protein